MTSFSRMRISVAVNGSSISMESVLNVGLYFEKMGFYSQCHIINHLFSQFDKLNGIKSKPSLYLS